MIDIHAHILPAVDDGASDLGIALEMLTTAEACGVTDIIATPHILDKYTALPWGKIVAQAVQLQSQARSSGLKINIHPGAELEMNLETLTLPEYTGLNHPYALAGSYYVLVELPGSMIPHYADDFWHSLHSRGLLPILAHPERHMPLMQQPRVLDSWRANGLLIQCTANSLTGAYGSKAQKYCEWLLTAGYIDFFATDAHDNQRRSTNLRPCVELLSRYLDAPSINKLLYTNPKNILNNTKYKE